MTWTSSCNSERSLLPPLPAFLLKAANPDPFPSRLYPCGSVREDFTLTYLGPQIPAFHWPDNICLWYLILPPNPAISVPIPLSLLCNLISSSWFPVICNNGGKRKFPPNHNDHELNSKSVTLGGGRGGSKKPILFCRVSSNTDAYPLCYINSRPSYVPNTMHAELAQVSQQP